MENQIEVKQSVYHSVKLGKIETDVDTVQLKLLSLYLAVIISTPLDYVFIMKTVSGKDILFIKETHGVRVYRCVPAPEEILTGFIPIDELRELSEKLEWYSAETIYATTLFSHASFGTDIRLEGDVVYSKDSDHRYPYSLYVDNDNRYFVGISGLVRSPDCKVELTRI